jgi:hypothetical protein
LGAVYVLHELALKEGKYRQQIVQILCSHVRSKTSEVVDQETLRILKTRRLTLCIPKIRPHKVGV